MKKIILFLLLLYSVAFSQVNVLIDQKPGESIKIDNSSLKDFFERRINAIESINGKDWTCILNETEILSGEKVAIIETLPIAFTETVDDVTVKNIKVDMIQYNFKKKEKKFISKGSNEDVFKYPKKAKDKIKKIKDKKK